MSVALSSTDEDVIQRVISAVSEAILTPKDQLASVYALGSCSEWVKKHAYKRIALQFPDILLGDSITVCQQLAALTDQKCFVLGDTTFGSCCVDEIAAEHASCDAIIHFGPSCLSPTGRLPVALVFPSSGVFDLPLFSLSMRELLLRSDPTAKFVILYDTSQFSITGALEECVPSAFTISQLVVSENQTVICADARCQSFLHQNSAEITVPNVLVLEVSHRIFPRPASNDLADVTYIYIGSTSPCMVNLFLQLPASRFYSYHPASNFLSLESSNINKRIMRRFYLIERAKDASIVGILIGTLGVKDYLEIIQRLKKMLKSVGKRFYTFSMGKPNPAKLANFMEVDVFVYVACPESSFDSKEYLKPVVTPHEMEIACGLRQIIDGFVPDFRNLLPGGTAHAELLVLDDNCPDVSLVTGKARVTGIDTGHAQQSEPSSKGEVVLRDQVLIVSTQQSAGDFLTNRSWQGLEPQIGHDLPGDIVEGRHGIASSYDSEADAAQIVLFAKQDTCCGGCDL